MGGASWPTARVSVATEVMTNIRIAVRAASTPNDCARLTGRMGYSQAGRQAKEGPQRQGAEHVSYELTGNVERHLPPRKVAVERESHGHGG